MINTNNNHSDNNGFTLVELVMVIVIISVLAAVAMPRMVNLKIKALNNADNAIINELRAAIKSTYIKNVASGMPPVQVMPFQVNGVWPAASDFFTLLNPTPKYSYSTYMDSFAANSQDNVTWRIIYLDPMPDSYSSYLIVCPHATCAHDAGQYDVNWGWPPETYKGKVWQYYIGDPPPAPYKQGDITNLYDYGH